MTPTPHKGRRSRSQPDGIAQDASASLLVADQPRPPRGQGLSAASPEASTPAAAPQSDHEAAPPARVGETALPSPAAKVTKTAQLEALLAAPEGATLAHLCDALGWQPHTVRAALTRLRQAGHVVERSKAEAGETVYRIVPAAPAPAPVEVASE